MRRHNYPNLDLVNINVHIIFGQILTIGSQDIKQKRSNYRSRKDRTTGQGKYSVGPLFQSKAINNDHIRVYSTGARADNPFG